MVRRPCPAIHGRLALAVASAFAAAAIVQPTAALAQFGSLTYDPTQTFMTLGAAWFSVLQNLAFSLYGVLFTIELMIVGYNAALFKDNIAEFFGTMVWKFAMAMTMLAVIGNAGQIFPGIVNMFQRTAIFTINSTSSGTGVSITNSCSFNGPSGMPAPGCTMGNPMGLEAAMWGWAMAYFTAADAAKIFDSATGTGAGIEVFGNSLPGLSNAFMFGHDNYEIFCMALGMMLLTAAMTIFIEYLLLTFETQIVLSIGVIFLAFQGSRFTAQFSQGYMSYVINIGTKFFAFYFVVAILEQMFLGTGPLSIATTIATTLAGLAAGAVVPFGAGAILIAAATSPIPLMALVASVLVAAIPNIAGSILSGSPALSASAAMQQLSSSLEGASAAISASKSEDRAKKAKGRADSRLADQRQRSSALQARDVDTGPQGTEKRDLFGIRPADSPASAAGSNDQPASPGTGDQRADRGVTMGGHRQAPGSEVDSQATSAQARGPGSAQQPGADIVESGAARDVTAQWVDPGGQPEDAAPTGMAQQPDAVLAGRAETPEARIAPGADAEAVWVDEAPATGVQRREAQSAQVDSSQGEAPQPMQALAFDTSSELDDAASEEMLHSALDSTAQQARSEQLLRDAADVSERAAAAWLPANTPTPAQPSPTSVPSGLPAIPPSTTPSAPAVGGSSPSTPVRAGQRPAAQTRSTTGAPVPAVVIPGVMPPKPAASSPALPRRPDPPAPVQQVNMSPSNTPAAAASSSSNTRQVDAATPRSSDTAATITPATTSMPSAAARSDAPLAPQSPASAPPPRAEPIRSLRETPSSDIAKMTRDELREAISVDDTAWSDLSRDRREAISSNRELREEALDYFASRGEQSAAEKAEAKQEARQDALQTQRDRLRDAEDAAAASADALQEAREGAGRAALSALGAAAPKGEQQMQGVQVHLSNPDKPS